ncbi:polysaccharide biosynthesis C-terminal domain-containing protein [Capnocytophaga leadbetteri]|uniref:MATE family efflux transporter n=1 Tax=Capnocytophaga leadbetteri TaxID=327575 RepID=UPI0028D4D9BF|nr:polysaccharide biosynthesis C-terminal domain-containing protein [Capnocytophaga leadbetteri]
MKIFVKILSYIKNPTYLYQVFGQLSSQLFGFLLGMFLVRIAGVEVSGGYNSLLAIMNMSIGMIYSGILTNYLRNAIVKDYFLALITFITATFAFFLLLLPVFLFLGYNFINLVYIYIITLFINFIQISVYSLRLRRMDNKVFLPNVLPVGLLIIALFAFKPNSLIQFLYIALLSWSVSLFFVRNDLRHITFAKITTNKIWNYIKDSKILMFTMLMTLLYGNLDTILIKYLMGDTLVGYYKIAMSLTMFVMPAIGIFSFIYLSEIKNYIENNNYKVLLQKRKQQLFLILFITVLFSLFCLCFNRYIIPFLYGVTSDKTVWTSVILSFSVMFNALSMVNSYTLVGMGKEHKILKITFIAAGVNVVGNLLLIPYIDILGAALASVLTQMFIFVYNSYVVRKELESV